MVAGSWRQQRRSIRLAEYDYAGDGAYFVTICAYQRACLFGTVVDGEMYLSPAGVAVNRCWEGLIAHFPHIILDSFVVMPNHLHGIITINNEVLEGWHGAQGEPTNAPGPGRPVAGSVGVIVGSFKSAAAKAVNALRGTEGRGVWQRNYYEVIIRNEKMLNSIRQYILANPANWAQDDLYER